MKSKKIIAMIVAFAAFMAVATSGFAAVTTTTTYNEIADKVVVNVEVTEATAGSEVTYLVKSGNDIVYIDQKTATDGTVAFDYKIAKDKIVDLDTDVKFGTNGAAKITDTTDLYFANVAVTVDANATIEFFTDAACTEASKLGATAVVGTEDVIYAKVNVDDGFEIDQVSGLINGVGNVYEVQGNAISVTTKAIVVTPEIQVPEQEELKEIISEDTTVENAQGETVAAKAYTKVVKVVGQPKEVGVIYDGYKFPALTTGGAYESGKLYAVRIIVGGEVVVDTLQTYMDVE